MMIPLIYSSSVCGATVGQRHRLALYLLTHATRTPSFIC